MELRDPLRLQTRDIVRVLALIFGFYVLLRLLWIAHPVIFLFFLGVLFGLPLAQGADWLQKRKLPRALGVAIILTAFLGLLTAGGVWMAPILRAQSRELQVRLPEAMDKIDAWLGHRANGVLGILFNQEGSADSVRVAAAQRADSSRGVPETASAAVISDSTIDSTAALVPGAAVRTTTRTHEVEVGGNLRREITRQFRGAQHSFLRVLTSTFAVSGAFMLVLFIAAFKKLFAREWCPPVYPSQSEADLGLCSLLAEHCGPLVIVLRVGQHTSTAEHFRPYSWCCHFTYSQRAFQPGTSLAQVTMDGPEPPEGS